MNTDDIADSFESTAAYRFVNADNEQTLINASRFLESRGRLIDAVLLMVLSVQCLSAKGVINAVVPMVDQHREALRIAAREMRRVV